MQGSAKSCWTIIHARAMRATNTHAFAQGQQAAERDQNCVKSIKERERERERESVQGSISVLSKEKVQRLDSIGANFA